MSTSELRFVVLQSRDSLTPGPYPAVALYADGWDDYALKTTYHAELHESPERRHDLGKVKILHTGQETGRTPLPTDFHKLDSSFCSLGQNIQYYETLVERVPDWIRATYLLSLQDLAAHSSIHVRFAKETGFKTSLLRYGQAVNALRAGRDLLAGKLKKPGRMSFALHWLRGTPPMIADFSYDDSDELPGRCHVLIGYNGVGKTTLLADIAVAASQGRDSDAETHQSKIRGEDTTFGAVIAVSYSAFDTFKTPDIEAQRHESASEVDFESPRGVRNPPNTEAFGYTYCGLRRITQSDSVKPELGNSKEETFELKSVEEIEAEFRDALEKVGNGPKRPRDLLISAFKTLAEEPSFGRAGIDLGLIGKGVDTVDVTVAFRRLSTGHKIVLNIVAQLAAHLRTRSLVLIDEPETHLHPPLTATLLSAILGLLEGHDSFAILATHSPVVVQEMQSRYVRMLERYGSDASVRPVRIETFGTDIGAITRHIFSLDNRSTDYEGTLKRMAERHSLDEIDGMFVNGLSPQARALVLNYQAEQ